MIGTRVIKEKSPMSNLQVIRNEDIYDPRTGYGASREDGHHLVNLPDYWRSPIKPRNFLDFCDMVDTGGKPTGLWEFVQWDPKTGEVRKREWNKNVITDDGAIEIFKCAINSAVPAAVFNN